MSTARLCVTFDERSGRLHVRWTARDRATWRSILASFKETFPQHRQCTFCTTTRSWSMPLSARVLLGAWADHWFRAEEQHWDDEEEPEPATRGGPPPAGGGRAPQSLAEAHALLFLTPEAPLWAAEAVYRAGMKRAHPDAGGDHASAVRLARAMETIRAHQERSA